MQKVLITLLIINGFILVYTFMADPLLLPFQDWDQMPKGLQEFYIAKSKKLSELKPIVFTILCYQAELSPFGVKKGLTLIPF